MKKSDMYSLFSGRAKGAAKGSCAETVVQKGVLESPFLLCPLKVFKDLSGVLPFLRTTPLPLLWRALIFFRAYKVGRTAVQMGGALLYKLEPYCSTFL